MSESAEYKLKRKIKTILITFSFNNQITITFTENSDPVEAYQLFKRMRKRVSEHYSNTPIFWWIRRLRTEYKEMYPCIHIFTYQEIDLTWLRKYLEAEINVETYRLEQRCWTVNLQEKFLNNKEMFNQQIFKSYFKTNRVNRQALTNQNLL